MTANSELVKALERFGPHDHLCSIYETPEDHFAVAVPFISIGLERREQCIYIADDNTVDTVSEALRAGGVDVEEAIRSGKLLITTKEHAYLKRGHFDPDWMFTFWAEAADRATAAGFTALRATGETEWVVRGAPGLERWMEYESRLTHALAESNAFALCQYNRNVFPPEIVLDIIRTHPIVIYGKTVCRNFYFVPPEEFLRPDQPGREAERLLTNIRERERIEQELRRAGEELEFRVAERTAELARANRELEAEIAARRRLESDRDRFFSVSRDLIAITDFEGRFLYVNPAWERTLGYTTDELLGRRAAEFVHPEDREASVRARERFLASGTETLSYQNRYRARDGAYRWFLWNVIALPEEQRIYGAGRDITELKAAEEELRDREERFRKLFDDAPIGASLVGLDGRFLRVNHALCEMLGYSEADLVGRSLNDITEPEDLAATEEQIERLLRGEISAYRLEKRDRREDGRRVWLDATVTLIRRDDGTPLYLLGMAENITERKQRDEEIRTLNRELEQKVADLTALNKELETFTYSVSHDLRAPLRHIDGFAQILAEKLDAGAPAEAGAAIGRIREGAQQMGRMVEDLLALARTGRTEVKRQVTGLRAVVEEVLSELQAETAGREIRFEVGDLPFVDCDPALVKQALANLISNAVKFTRPRRPAIIEIGCTVREGSPVVFVRDNGVGFSMKSAGRLFGAFQRLHRREDFEGTGMGLAMVQRIVHKHGGRVWAEAELNRGATFYFTLSPGRGAASQDRAAATSR